MVLYICPRCNYTTHQVSDLKRHFRRKIPCTITNKFVSIEECLNELNNRKSKKTLRNPEKITKNIKKTPKSREKTKKTTKKRKKHKKKDIKNISCNTSSKNESEIIIIPNNKAYCCIYCGCDFTRKDNLKVHMENYCKNRPMYKNENIEIVNLKRQLEYAKKIREEDQKHNNTFNIVINPFGKENTTYITNEYIKKLIDLGPYSSIPKLLKHIHFNPEHKENNNIKITNRKQPYVQIYNGEKWLLKNKKETIENISDTAYTILNEHYEGDNKYMNKFNKEYNTDFDVTKKIQKKVELLILNSIDPLKE